MPDFPSYTLVPPPVLTPFSAEAYGHRIFSGLDQIFSGTWPTANKAFFYPFTLTGHATVYQLLFFVGGTSNGNIDVGIYDNQKNLVISSGSTAMSATINTVQELNVTDTPLPPGQYLLAGACSSLTGTVMRTTAADEAMLSVCPVYEQTSALALPNPCTPVLATEAIVPLMGIGAQLHPIF